MVKFLIFTLLSITIINKTYAASNNLFFTAAQFLSYCKSNNLYEQGICDGYIIAVNDVIFSIDKKRTDPQSAVRLPRTNMMVLGGYCIDSHTF